MSEESPASKPHTPFMEISASGLPAVDGRLALSSAPPAKSKSMSPGATAKTARRVSIIKALAHPSRLIIAEALQSGEHCVCDLRELVGGDLSTVSKHLSVMREAGLLQMEKRGLNVYYRLRCPCLMNFFDCVDSLSPRSGKARRKAGK